MQLYRLSYLPSGTKYILPYIVKSDHSVLYFLIDTDNVIECVYMNEQWQCAYIYIIWLSFIYLVNNYSMN